MSTDRPTAPVGLLLCDDMIFTSRITGTARDLGLHMKVARSLEALEDLAGREKPACVILDLGHPGLEVAEVVRRLRDGGSGPCVVAYGSHVDAATLRRARDAGCNVVLPRSKFVEELPRELTSWMSVDLP